MPDMNIITQVGASVEETLIARTWGNVIRRIRYDEFASIPHSLEPWMPIGSVEFCKLAMHHESIHEPAPIDYPECLQSFLVHAPTKIKVREVTSDLFHYHIKPVETKLPEDKWTLETMVWVQPHHCFIAEFRVYITNGNIIGYARYDDSDYEVSLDCNIIDQMIAIWKDAPAGYSIDVGLSQQDNKWYLVEINDGWALGYYQHGTCSRRDYLALLTARWTQLLTGH